MSYLEPRFIELTLVIEPGEVGSQGLGIQEFCQWKSWIPVPSPPLQLLILIEEVAVDGHDGVPNVLCRRAHVLEGELLPTEG